MQGEGAQISSVLKRLVFIRSYFIDIGGTALSGITGRSNVYNVSSATLTSYTTYQNNEGEQSLDEASLPNHYGLPTVDKEIKETMNIGKERKVLFSVRNFLIVLALSVHSIFEGMAIGKCIRKYIVRPLNIWLYSLELATY